MEKNDLNKQAIEGIAINPEHAKKVVNGLIDDERFFKHLVGKLGDALMFVASPGSDDLGIPEHRETVLEALAETRRYFYNSLQNIEQLKRGELPDYLNEN